METQSPTRTAGAIMRDIAAELGKGNIGAAETLFMSLSPAIGVVLAAADLAIQNLRWAEAAWLLDKVPGQQGPVAVKRCLSRNLAALQQHRPGIYHALIALPQNDGVRIGTAACGHPTIVCRAPNGVNVALSPANMPLQGLSAALARLKPVIESGQSFALCGIGDGYLLHELAQKPPKLYLDSEQAIFVLEPNAHIALTAMMIHDYTGSAGPIEQARFQWFIGQEWEARLRQAIFGDLLLPCPHISVGMGLWPEEMQKTVNAIVAELIARDDRNREEVANYYSKLDPAAQRALFGENPPRRPRALFLTTRFSTVLQYSTRAAAIAFEQAGWETRTLIEPTPHHRIMTVGTRQMLATYKPDLVFQIDHLRHESPGIVPPSLPFVCWIQDHMEQLMTKHAGTEVGPYDFVLTDAGPVYAHNYGYSSRQIIAMPKLTAPPALLPRPARTAEDLVYVSNNTRSPEALLDRLLQASKGNAAEQNLMTECWRRLIDLHAVGDTLANYRDVHQFVRDLAIELNIELTPSRLDELARVVNHPVVDALYRHQALGWIAAAADELGLKFSLYGNGWEHHPDFARFARGPVNAGAEQEQLTRRSAINFQIAPYICLHQRLLDGVCTGGFFMIRRHVSNVSPQALLDLLETHCGPGVGTLNAARQTVPPPMRDRFERLVKDCNRCLRFSGDEDPIELVRAFEEAKLLMAGVGVLPHLDAVSFADPASTKERIAHFISNPDLREQIMLEQRQSIAGRFAYSSAMKRVSRRIGELLPDGRRDAFIGIPIKIDIGQAA